VIGVDMTPEMITKARGNISKTDLQAVQFRLGEIEHLPVADASIDAIMSNRVINLSTDKPAVFCDAYQVLAPGGRLAISDTLRSGRFPLSCGTTSRRTPGASGAALIADVEEMLRDAGFQNVRVGLKSNTDARDESCQIALEPPWRHHQLRAARPIRAALATRRLRRRTVSRLPRVHPANRPS